MPDKESLIAKTLRGVQAVGLARTIQAAIYPMRRAYHEARFSAQGRRGSVLHGIAGVLTTAWQKRPGGEPGAVQNWTLLGDVVSHQRDGQTLSVYCQNAALQLTVLAADVLRVRLIPAEQTTQRAGSAQALAGPNGGAHSLGAPHSYTPYRADSEWAPAPYALTESQDEIEVRTERLVCRITKRPCRLSFCDTQGQVIHADRAGLAWQGKRVARFAALAADEHVYGLGERAFPLDLRGRSYALWNIDPQNYHPGRDPLYLSIPFYIGLQAGQGYGILYDNTYRAGLDLGEGNPDEAVYLAEDGEPGYYFFYGPTLGTILERYTELTGRMALPPLWALGYQQSRWSYYPEARVREIARLMREHRIPCDALYLDIHYMDGYRCFTWHRQRFPDPTRLLSDLHEQGYKVVVTVDPGIKADHHYAVCADGLERGAFCTYPDGGVAGGPVWPGEAYFPDFTDPRVRDWWGDLYEPLLQAGVDGIWNDMNEPTVIGPQGDTLANCVRHDWEGQGTDHRQAHNVYGLLTARATAEGLRRLRPEQRPFVLTRSGWAGVQRYALHWTGDNLSTWEHLQLTMPMVLNLGLSGLAFTGADVGGFDGNADGELLVRWTQMGAFLPLFRNHCSLWSSNQEPWAFGEPYLSLNRAAIELRYRLLPYLYTATWQCAQKGTPIARPLLWAYPDDPATYALDDQFLCGDALLVAPIYHPGATSRQVYLPAGEWFDFWTDERHTGPKTLTATAPLEYIPVYVRAGTVLPTWPVMQHTSAGPVDRLILHVYPGDGTSWLYEDDGQSLAYQGGGFSVTRFECQRTGENGCTTTRRAQGAYRPAYSGWECHIHGVAQRPQHVLTDGEPVENLAWDEASHILRFESGEVQRIETR
jgi:alpha-glucosidase